MRSAAILCTLVLGVCSWIRPARADDYSPVGKAKVLINGEGMIATMVTLKPKGSQGRVALLVEGTQTALDGVVRLLLINEQGRGADFVRVDASGKQYVALATREGWSSSRDFMLSVPGRRGAVRVYWDPKRSDKADITRIVNRLLLRRMGKAYPKSELEKQASDAFAQAARAANAACTSGFKAELQLTTFNEQALKALDVGAACGAVLKAIEKLCDDKLGKDAIKQKVKSVSCRLGSKLELDLRGGKLGFSTALDTPGQEEWAKEVLLNKL